jgi:hypothetical protein
MYWVQAVVGKEGLPYIWKGSCSLHYLPLTA